MKHHNLAGLITVGDKVKIQARGKRGIYTAEFWHNGQHRRRSLKTSNLTIARRRAVALEAELAAGEYAPRPRPVTISAAVGEYITAKDGEGRAKKTTIKYRQWLDDFAAFAAEHDASLLQQVTPHLFEQFRAERRAQHSGKGLYTGLTIIKQLIKWVSGSGRSYLAQNPLAQVKISEPYCSPKFTPTAHQVQAILNSAEGDRRLQIMMLAMTGLRAGELQMLRPRDVDLEQGWIQIVAHDGWVPKTRAARRVPIHPQLLTELQSYAQRQSRDRRYFYCAPASREYPGGNHHIDLRQLNEDLQKVAKELGFPVGRRENGIVIHSLRHFFETQAVDSRVPQFVVDAWMGHAGASSMGRIYYGQSDSKSKSYMRGVRFSEDAVADHHS